ncbi:hypothetical protein LRR18_07540 [Mangrovimonas sp. AS39]|uniref:hypothetical protein n=1 Tax=Mangrovimonas futianensis TaxID=2895523 RepID=UPI001E5279E4|nr:hypothetical protein [Mangrovimonas futianensis]MCF1191433.1 hypothetical protein [Mangrovimonas futianensis]MCF1195128.1 hypothetical protein [Mangrovimonas futianensis]MCF1421195.1 hypothetical protein [Mangrovimonas futianensis]
MKKRIALLSLLFISLYSVAQEKGTNDINFGIGFETSNEFLNTVEDIISGVSYRNTTVTPAFILTYKIAVKNKWFVYADGAYQQVTEDVVENNLTTGDATHRYITVGFGSSYHYISKNWFQMYSGASVAYTSQYSNFSTSSNLEDKSDGYFNFHVSALGFRFGKALAGFAEIGVGYKGFANVGISYQF